MSAERVTIAVASPEESVRAAILERARRRGFARFHFLAGHAPPAGPGEEVVVRDGDRLVAAGPGGADVKILTLADSIQLEAAATRVGDGGVLALEWTADRVIPLENALAARGRRYAVWVYARTPAEAPGALGALEHGADRVFVEVRRPEEVDDLESLLDRPASTDLTWVRAPVVAVRPAGLGDRVLVDTTSILRPEEGLLVGSAAAFLFHVASEAVGSRFSRARPFRVNAGAAHSYVLLADGTTRYLSELSPGDAVLVAAPEGPVRSARVGRIKIERRPMVMVTADDQGISRTIFLQEAETVRLSGDSGRVASTDAVPGLVVRGVRLPAARHLGRAVEETIEER